MFEIYKQTRITVRVDYTMRENLAQLRKHFPTRKLSMMVRSALRLYLKTEIEKQMSANDPAPSGEIAGSQPRSTADISPTQKVVAPGKAIAKRVQKTKGGR